MKEQIFPEKCRGILDVTKPPYCVDNTGEADCTAILCQIIDDLLQRQIDGVNEMYQKLSGHDGDVVIGFENRKIKGGICVLFPEFSDPTPTIYFPNGIYLVSDTVSYSHRNLQNMALSQRPRGMELNRHIRMLGQSRNGVVIKLKDNCKGYEFGQERPVISFMRGDRSNVAMSNYIENLTIDVGKGNPGAVGLVFFGNNNGSVRDVTIRSSDPEKAGAIGLGILHEIVSGCYVRDVLVDGFEIGIKVTPTRNFTVFENITVQNQRFYGMEVQQTITSIRNFKSKNRVSGLYVSGGAAHVVLTDGTFESDIPINMAAIRLDFGGVFFRNINTHNYSNSFTRLLSDTYGKDGYIEEYSTHGSFHLYADRRLTSMDLPVEQFPDSRPVEDISKWACAEDYGAVGDGIHDDADALQAAMDSGYPVVFLQPGRYRLSHPVSIPPAVEHFHCMYSDFVLDEELRNSEGEGVFRIVGESQKPLIIEKILAWEQCYGFVRFIRHDSKRTLYAKDILTQTCAFYFNTVPGGKLFIENVACTSGNIKYRNLPALELHGQTVWAHLFNPERAATEVLNDGGTFWLMGFKTEGDGPLVDTKNGGYTEVLGGIMSIGANHMKPIIRSEDSNVSVICATNAYHKRQYYPLAVSDIRKGEEKHLLSSDLPIRIDRLYFIPLYTGYSGAEGKHKKENKVFKLY